jgi:putative PIN family toxin of toxin-antitoxin system
MPTELRSVLDTNLIVSALLVSRTPPRKAFDRAADNGAILASPATFGELEDVLERRKFDRYVDLSKRREFLRLFASVIHWVQVSSTIDASWAPKDNMFLELAADGKADYLVTGDHDLLALAAPAATTWDFRIVTPEEFLAAEVWT